jgi:hypothetical protein
MWRSPRRFCRHDVLIRFPVWQSCFQKDSHAARRLPTNV